MKSKQNHPLPNELEKLCASVRALVTEKKYDDCLPAICRAMEEHPHAPQPHNLLGIVMEKMGNHVTAMKHFRAAWALDPTYTPAGHNLHTYGTFYSGGACAFDETDVPAVSRGRVEIVYDRHGIGHVASNTKVQYDERGIGRVIRTGGKL